MESNMDAFRKKILAINLDELSFSELSLLCIEMMLLDYGKKDGPSDCLDVGRNEQDYDQDLYVEMMKEHLRGKISHLELKSYSRKLERRSLVVASKRKVSSSCSERTVTKVPPDYSQWLSAWHSRPLYLGRMGNDCPACGRDNGSGGYMIAKPNGRDDDGIFLGCSRYGKYSYSCLFSSPTDITEEDFSFLDSRQPRLFHDLPQDFLQKLLCEPQKGLFAILRKIECMCPTCGKKTLVVRRRRGGGESSLFLACQIRGCRFTLSMYKFFEQIRRIMLQEAPVEIGEPEGHKDSGCASQKQKSSASSSLSSDYNWPEEKPGWLPGFDLDSNEQFPDGEPQESIVSDIPKMTVTSPIIDKKKCPRCSGDMSKELWSGRSRYRCLCCGYKSIKAWPEDFQFLNNGKGLLSQTDMFGKRSWQEEELLTDIQQGILNILKKKGGETGVLCPKCGEGYLELRRRNGSWKSGLFVGCSKYSKNKKGCKYTYPLYNLITSPEIGYVIKEVQLNQPLKDDFLLREFLGACSESGCGAPLARYGRLTLGCSRKNCSGYGVPLPFKNRKEMSYRARCPYCGGEMERKRIRLHSGKKVLMHYCENYDINKREDGCWDGFYFHLDGGNCGGNSSDRERFRKDLMYIGGTKSFLPKFKVNPNRAFIGSNKP